MSAEIRNDREMLCASIAGDGESLSRSVWIRLDAAPEVDTLPISSWLNSAMQFTLPSSTLKDWEDALSARDSTAQKLGWASDV